MIENALYSSPFYIVCGIIAYVASNLIKKRYREIEILNDNLPILPVLFGLLSGLLFNFLLPDIAAFTLPALIAGAKDGVLAGLASSKIYEQTKRTSSKPTGEGNTNETKDEATSSGSNTGN
jgi:hypothetical protein